LNQETSKRTEKKGQDQSAPPVRHGWLARKSLLVPLRQRNRLLASFPWLTFLLPFVMYMVVGSLEPAAPKNVAILPDGRPAPAVKNTFGLEYRHYPIVYTVKIALTLAAMIYVLPGYRQFPFRITPFAILVGTMGVVVWVGLCQLQLERHILVPIGLGKFLGLGERPAFNPLDQLAATPAWACTFLFIRFLGLALVVPIIEEFFLRGFLMRFFIREDWWNVPFGTVTTTAAIVGTAVPMLMHPAELLAAAAWFSLITWLMVRTRNLWDCVAAHAVTNLLLGVYVVTQEQWQLW
jgi:uncharacterized protein